MPRSKEIRISHPDLETEAVVLEESRRVYENAGWTVVDDGVSEQEGVEQPVAEPVQQQSEVRRTTTRTASADENKE
jgi:hypothetical protein